MRCYVMWIIFSLKRQNAMSPPFEPNAPKKKKAHMARRLFITESSDEELDENSKSMTPVNETSPPPYKTDFQGLNMEESQFM